jgi:hypothetical protein
MPAVTTLTTAFTTSPPVMARSRSSAQSASPAQFMADGASAPCETPIVSSGVRHSLIDLLLQILEGLFSPEPLAESTDRHAQSASGAPFHCLDTPAYLRRGVRIPELD